MLRLFAEGEEKIFNNKYCVFQRSLLRIFIVRRFRYPVTVYVTCPICDSPWLKVRSLGRHDFSGKILLRIESTGFDSLDTLLRQLGKETDYERCSRYTAKAK